MGERLLCKQEVIGSIPFSSTNRFSGGFVVIFNPARDSRQACGVCLWSFDRPDVVETRLFFNKLEEVKRTRCLQASCDGLDCIDPFSLEFGEDGYRKHP